MSDSYPLSPAHTDLLDDIASRESAMIEKTIELCDVNSGSYNNDGIAKVQTLFTELFSSISETVTTRELPPVPLVADNGTITEFQPQPMQLFKSRPEAPLQLLFTGHSDTVFPPESDFQTCWKEDNLLRGPGTADMKGGLVVAYTALAALEQSPFRDQFGFTVAISPDEEIGSPSSGAVLMELAREADYGMTYEPALADGTLAGARKGSGNFTLTAKGLSTHAGREFFAGRNAVTAIADAALRMERLSSEEDGITVNIGKITGGGAVNIVPDLCVCRFNVRINETEQQAQVEQAIAQIIADVSAKTGCELELHGQFNRPPKPMTDEQLAMFELLKSCGQSIGISVAWRATGGCCEGNNLAAAGLLNIDTLGVRGAHIHSTDEYACMDSFVERVQLSALMITRLIDLKTQ